MGGFRTENREDVALFYEIEGCQLQECTGKNESRLGWHLSQAEVSQSFLDWFCHVNAAATSWGRQCRSCFAPEILNASANCTCSM